MLAVPVDGGELAVASWGPDDGPVVVAAHGITSSHVFWTLVGERVAAEGVRLLAPDLRGRGRSAGLAGASSIGRHAEDLIAVLDHVGVGSAVLAGHSMGGFVTSVAAVRHPDRVARLVLVDGGPPLTAELAPDADVEAVLHGIIGPSLDRLAARYEDRQAYRAFWRAHPAFGAVSPALVDAYADHDLVADGDVWRSCVDREAVLADARDTLVSDEVRTAVGRVAVPLTFLYAERGMLDGPEGLYPSTVAEGLAGRGVDVALVPDVNHFTIGLASAGADAVAEALLRAVRGPGRG